LDLPEAVPVLGPFLLNCRTGAVQVLRDCRGDNKAGVDDSQYGDRRQGGTEVAAKNGIHGTLSFVGVSGK
jgi:hypothetical protein